MSKTHISASQVEIEAAERELDFSLGEFYPGYYRSLAENIAPACRDARVAADAVLLHEAKLGPIFHAETSQ